MDRKRPPFDSNLRDAVNRLYSVFSVYPAPTELAGSPYKDVAGMFRNLQSAPLEELSDDAIGPYAASAILTVGGVAEYKHYLPRIIEQGVLLSAHLGPEPEIIAGRLSYADWKLWPKEEQAAIRAAFHAAWSWAVDQDFASWVRASDWLCAIALLGEPIGPVLEEWSSRPSRRAVIQAAWLGVEVEHLTSDPAHSMGWWTKVAKSDQLLVVDWATNSDRAASFEAAVDLVGEDDRRHVERALKIARRRLLG